MLTGDLSRGRANRLEPIYEIGRGLLAVSGQRDSGSRELRIGFVSVDPAPMAVM